MFLFRNHFAQGISLCYCAPGVAAPSWTAPVVSFTSQSHCHGRPLALACWYVPKRATMRRLGVCVISSHPLALEDLARPLAGSAFRVHACRPDVLGVAAAPSSARDARKALPALPRAAVYVFDAHAPRPIVETLLADLLAANEKASLIVVAEKFAEPAALSFLHLGVRGLLTYAESRERLPEAVRSVAAGGYWVPRVWLGLFVDSVLGSSSGPHPPARIAGVRTRLSRREQQVLDALLTNLVNKEIAVRLNISERTVKFHVSNLLAKFGVRRRADLILLSYQSGGG